MPTLTKIEKKMAAKYKAVKVSDCDKAGFILSDGSIVNTTGHAASCRAIGHSVAVVIKAGVCRYMSYSAKQGGVIAFEYTSLTVEQKITINLLLRTDDFYVVYTTENAISRFRPIRKIKF